MTQNYILHPIAIAAICLATIATAQTRPDAGRSLQQNDITPVLPSQREFEFQIPQNLEKIRPGGKKVLIKTIKISGNSKIVEKELLNALPREALDKPLDLSEIQKLSEFLSDVYRKAGYPFATVMIPAQTLQNGVLQLLVIEGRYGNVTLNGDASSAEKAREYLSGLRPGEIIESTQLERPILLLGDLPGIKITPVIRPGQEQGTGDLVVSLKATRELGGDVAVDNYGNRYNGEYRVRTNLRYNSPFMLGDQFTFSSLATDEKMWMGSLGYSFPVEVGGLRVSTGISRTYYELGKEFSNIRANGEADTLTVGITYPLLRSLNNNVILSTQWQYKILSDRQDAARTSSLKSSTSVPLMLSFDMRDGFMGGGSSFGSVTYTQGQLKLDTETRATDIDTANTEGTFGKIGFDVARLQNLPVRNLSFYLRGSGQWSGSKNLDSSEGFGAGGQSGVRAYPLGEAYGDSGWFAQAEMRYSLGAFEPYAFYDAGFVTVNATPWNVGVNDRNIAGSGLGVRYRQGSLTGDAALAWRNFGGKPQSDSEDRIPRLWVSMGYQF